MQECTTVLFHRKKTKNNHKNVRKTCYWKLVFVICSYSTWACRHAKYERHVGTWTRKTRKAVGTWARKQARHVRTWARKHARHVGTRVRKARKHFSTLARKHSRHVGTRARNAKHVGMWARKHARQADTWALTARNSADSKIIKTPGFYDNAHLRIYSICFKTRCVFINRNSVFADWTKWKENKCQWKYNA